MIFIRLNTLHIIIDHKIKFDLLTDLKIKVLENIVFIILQQEKMCKILFSMDESVSQLCVKYLNIFFKKN